MQKTQATLDFDLLKNAQSFLDSLLTSFRDGAESLNATLLTKWSVLEDSVRHHHGDLQEGTVEELNGYLSMIDTITSGIISVEDDSQIFFDELETDLTKIINEQMNDLVIAHDKSHSFQPLPSYVKPSFDWLLSNLHNPYPSKEVRKRICRNAGASTKAVDAWFTDARKRIGWNELRRSRFKNRQDDIVEAATRVFLPITVNSVNGKNGYHHEFIAIQQRALRQYWKLFGDNTHQAKLTSADFYQQTPKFGSRKRKIPYPSPVSSPAQSPSPEPSFFDSRTASELPDSVNELPSTDNTLLLCDKPLEQISYLPSPAWSASVVLSDDEDINSNSSDVLPLSTGKRKRTTSDAEEPPSKRPHTLPSRSSINSTSKGFLTQSTSSHIDLLCEIPAPVCASVLDDSTFDIEVPSFHPFPIFETDFMGGGALPVEQSSLDDNAGELTASTMHFQAMTPWGSIHNPATLGISQLGFDVEASLDEFLSIEALSLPNFPVMSFPDTSGFFWEGDSLFQSHHGLDHPFVPLLEDESPPTLQHLDCNALTQNNEDRLQRIEHLRKELQLLEAEV